MSEFDALLAEYTEKGKDGPKVHGVLCKCIDKNGKVLYSKLAGSDSFSPDASPLREDAVFKLASCTKLFASIALLQCIDKGLIGLDEPLTKILPELDGKEIVSLGPDGEILSQPSKNKITARQLLTHTSGLGYRFLEPVLMKWSEGASTEAQKIREGSQLVTEKYNTPLLFEPGEGWKYGSSCDWAGTVVRRLHNNMSLEDYMIENIWKRVGLTAPFPTFAISQHPEYLKRLMQMGERTPEGRLGPWLTPNYGDNPEDQEGGCGLAMTAKDFLAVLEDLISDHPKLLTTETLSLMFTPQLKPDSPALSMLMTWGSITGPVPKEEVNHGLGGLLVVGGAPEIGQPRGLLTWAGACNSYWFACRESGVAGFFGTQITPFGDPHTTKLVDAWRADVWKNLNASP